MVRSLNPSRDFPSQAHPSRRRTAGAFAHAALLMLCIGAAAPAMAQGFSPPGQAPGQAPGMTPPPMPAQAGPPPLPAQGLQPPPLPQSQFGQQPAAQPNQFGQQQPGGFGQPQPNQFGQPQPNQFGQPPQGGGFGGQQQPGFGFNAPTNQPQQQPQRPNYADELTDFGVPPQSTLQTNVGSPTPTTIPGGHVITTTEVRQALGSDILMVDVWDSPPHASIPGSVAMPGAGNPGTFSDNTQQQLWNALAQLTQRQPQHPIIFFCTGSQCWESYNAALRAINMGFQVVLWYRGGLSAWQTAGMPMTQPGQTNQGMSQQNRVGFGQ